MHSFTTNDGTKFLYNSDLSGDVIISRSDGGEIEVSGVALLAFVAEHVRSARIATLERLSTEALLGLPEETP